MRELEKHLRLWNILDARGLAQKRQVEWGIHMKNRALFICLTGIDGSGKTTQARSLVDWMKGHEITCRYVWNRFEPHMLKPFLLILNKIFMHKKAVSSCHTKKNMLIKHSSLAVIYKYFLLLDYFLQIYKRVTLPLLFGTSVICDRYIYDTIVDIALIFNYSYEQMNELLVNSFRFISCPDLVFLVDTPESIAYQRKDDIPSLDYLIQRREVYQKLAKENKMIILDGSKSIEFLEDIIRKEVDSLMRHA